MASWNKKQMLTTGTDASIGSHLIERLVEEVANTRVKNNLDFYRGKTYAH